MRPYSILTAARHMSQGGRTALHVEIDEAARDYDRIRAALPEIARDIAWHLSMNAQTIIMPDERSPEDQAFMNSLGADPDEAGTLERIFLALADACERDTGLGLMATLCRDGAWTQTVSDPDAGTPFSTARRPTARVLELVA